MRYQILILGGDDMEVKINYNYGFLPNKKDLKEIIDHFTEIYNEYSDEDIKEENTIISEEIHREMIEQEKKIIHKEDHGYIYFIQDSNGYVKIGKTTKPDMRLKKYITENSGEIKILKIIKNSQHSKEENKFHKLFENKRHRNEWFNLDENDIKYISSLNGIECTI